MTLTDGPDRCQTDGCGRWATKVVHVWDDPADDGEPTFRFGLCGPCAQSMHMGTGRRVETVLRSR